MAHFSHRLRWPTAPNALSQAVSRMRAQAIPLLDLTSANPTETLEDYPHTSIANALAQIDDFSYQPHAFGDTEARTVIAGWHAQRGIRSNPKQIVLTASTSEAYSLLFKLLCDPGDEILIPTPSYPLFDYLAALDCVRTVPYRLEYDGSWFLDMDSVERAISERTRAIVVVHPNNPTGSYLTNQEMTRLLALAGERGVPVISDEVFLIYSQDAKHAAHSVLNAEGGLRFSLNGLSKSAGMPQMKLGWIAMEGAGEQTEELLERLELIADTYLSPGIPVQKSLPELLRIGAQIAGRIEGRLRINSEMLTRRLRHTAIEGLRREGGWSAILRLPRVRDEETWAMELLEKHHTLVQPGYFFDMADEPYAVVSLLTRPEYLAEGIEQLLKLAEQ